MFYKPSYGKMKDNCIVFHEGRYYLYSMYAKHAEYNAMSARYNNVWLAISDDGVHFSDYGCVIENHPTLIWAMKVHRVDGTFYMNAGSFSESGAQNRLLFWSSKDLLHWTPRPDLMVTAPPVDGCEVRLDCMNALQLPDGSWYGYATGYYNFLRSPDGIHWEITEGSIETAPFPPFAPGEGGFEIADCFYLDGRYFLLSGAFGYMGMPGYGVYVYTADAPQGPFRPLLPSFRVNGNSGRWVNVWERAFLTEDGVLAHNYMYNSNNYELGLCHLPPIKRFSYENGELILKWWEKNEAARGELCACADSLRAQTECRNIWEPDAAPVTVTTDALLSGENFIEGILSLEPGRNWTDLVKGGLYLEDTRGFGTVILFDCSGKVHICTMKDGTLLAVEDEIGYGCAAPYWLEPGKEYTFRIVTRHGLFEVYLDDRYLQTFNTAHIPGQDAAPICRAGAAALRGACCIKDLRIYNMR